jgi:hypothetical protein
MRSRLWFWRGRIHFRGWRIGQRRSRSNSVFLLYLMLYLLLGIPLETPSRKSTLGIAKSIKIFENNLKVQGDDGPGFKEFTNF